MRHNFFILTITLILMSCGQTDTKQKDLELKEKELSLKEKELELQEKGLNRDSVRGNQDSGTNINKISIPQQKTNNYIVLVDKSYFYNAADFTTQRKGYLVKNQTIQVEKTSGGFAFVNYVSPSGSQTSGWMLLSQINKVGDPLPTEINPNRNEYGEYYFVIPTGSHPRNLLFKFFQNNSVTYSEAVITNMNGDVYQNEANNGTFTVTKVTNDFKFITCKFNNSENYKFKYSFKKKKWIMIMGSDFSVPGIGSIPEIESE